MMSGKIVIRKAQERDVTRIHELIRLAKKSGKILKRSKAEIKGLIHHFWVAEENEDVVACCALETYNRKLAEIRSLAVHDRYRGRGIASGLVDRCLREAKKKRVYEVLAITDRENIFKRFGFSEQLHGQKALFARPAFLKMKRLSA
ncbi:MAG TPA: GNAT family N-acetyltransferase [Elusimicrobiota bacterium]|nr:GNAT family N-acetyltransferase [Elusimicrobiota bacterium]